MNRLFNPFRYIAGTKALIPGIIFIISSALLLYSDGMIQSSYIHIGFANATFWQVLLVQFVWWIIPTILLYAGGLVMSKSRIRIIDILGTTAFSQLILIPMIAPMLLPAVKDGTQNIINTLLQGITPAVGDMLAVMIYAIWSIVCLVLFYVWNYNAFATSCNLKGAKPIAYFIFIQIVITVVGSII